jgi:uncharacterized protein (TIGR03437 family)
MRTYSAALAALLVVPLLQARQDKFSCGTHPDRWQEEFHLHAQSGRHGIKRLRAPGSARLASEREIGGRTVLPDIGNIAILDDSDGVVSRRNSFNLNRRSLVFTPRGEAYRYEVSGDTYDATAAAAGTPVSGLADDDSREISLPFPFPWYGQQYQTVYVNSDGNLTFTGGDGSSSERSLGRMTSGPPRISGLFRDLDPSRSERGVVITSTGNSFVVTWDRVPEYRDFGTGPLQTFQIRLFPDGRVEFAWSDVSTDEAVVGIAPGRLRGATSVVSFLNTPSAEYTSTIAERFSNTERVDTFAASQKFFLNHEDTYDYLVFYNALGIAADDGAVAYEVTIRNSRTGYGDRKVDIGAETGSKSRLQAFMNMGPLNQYPKDPGARVPARLSVGDTPLTTLAHEAGHLFLALASVRDENDSRARPMLGGQASAHWNFAFNSEASLLEGNRIQDNGPTASPRFLTTATVEGFSPLDQYLMGFRSPAEVPDTFLVVNPRGGGARGLPRVGVAFDGDRRDIRIDEVVAAEGRRTPDHTVAQRRFRFAFILITAAGTPPTAEQVSQVESYRQKFEEFFNTATSGRAFADTALRRSVALSTWPAVGVIAGSTASATVSLEGRAETPQTVLLRTVNGNAQVPASVIIPAGATQALFTINGLRSGTDEIVAEPADPQYATTYSRLQVSSAESVRVLVASGDKQPATPGVPLPNPIRVRVTDANELPYPGVPVSVAVTGGGSLDRSAATTDETGVASVRWTPGREAANVLQVQIPGGATATATALGRPVVARNGVVNAASWTAGVTPGGLATVFGASLTGNVAPAVTLNGRDVGVLFADTGQINFLVPAETAPGTATLRIRNEVDASEPIPVEVLALQPGIFFDSATGYGAVLVSGTSQVTQTSPVARGGTIEIYGTGFGQVQPLPSGAQATVAPAEVRVANVPAEVLFSGLAPGFVGLYQINARIPMSVAPGVQPLVVSAAGISSNTVQIAIR